MSDYQMKYKGSELEALVEGSASSLFYAGTVVAAYSIPGRTAAQVTVSQAFRTKYNIGENKEVFYIVDKRTIAGDDSNEVYIYPADFEGCYFVMGDFEGNDAILDLGATAGDWVVVQGREWVKIATQQREIAGIAGNVTAEALATKLSTPTPTNADPLVKQSLLKDFVRNDEAVDFATDLTGVVEATPEMFTYRPSAGDKSVRDESAVIRRIKGNTSVWGQYVKNGDFAEGTRYFYIVNSTLSDNGDGSITITHKSDSSCGMATIFDTHIPRGHKILAVADYQRDNASSSRTFISLRRNGGGYDTSIISGIADARRRVDYAIITATDDITGFNFYPSFDSPAGTHSIVYTVAVYDLTAIFGAGNEPTTYDEFRKYYPDAYYPYCDPEVRAMRATGIETVGFNQWDEQWENGSFNTADGTDISNNQIRCKNLIRIFPNTYYSLSIGDNNLGIWAMFYDNNQNILQPVNLNSIVSRNCLYISPNGNINVFLTPENASWMKFYLPQEYGSTTYKGDICINLSHSGVRNGEYKPYEKNTLLLPEIAKYFPNGMHGIGDVFDEIDEEMAIQRIGEVDLGDLDWNIRTTNESNKYSWGAALSTPGIGTNEIANIVCAKYITASANEVYLLKDRTIAVLSNVLGISVNIYDSEYTAATDKDSFVASLQGVKLYYELAEPIYTPIDEPLQLDYKVDDFGTEKMLSDAPSSPFKADIVYQFNAEGRIRDNSRNIEKLEEQLQSAKEDIQNAGVQSDWLEDNPDSKAYIKNKPTMPTQVATAPEVITTTSVPSSILPNVVYMLLVGLERFTLPTLVDGDANAHNVWKVIFIPPAASNLTFPDNIAWKDGIAPNWTEAGGYCELTFTKYYNSWILGEWKLYK